MEELFRHSFLVMLQEGLEGRLFQNDFTLAIRDHKEVLLFEDPQVAEPRHMGVAQGRPKGLDQIQCERGLPISNRVEETDMRIKPHALKNGDHFVGDHDIGEGQEGVDRIGGRFASSLGELKVGQHHLPKSLEIEF